jgi:hypothetical protein
LPSHWSFDVQVFPSLQVLPAASGGYVQTPLEESHVPVSSVQPPIGGVLHVTAVPFWQTPLWHVATPLHRSPSSQFLPSVTGVWETNPVVVSHLSTVHGLLSLIGTALPATQLPFASHASPVVQALPSVHGVFAGFFGYVQVPPLHVPAAAEQPLGGGVTQVTVPHGSGLHSAVTPLQPNWQGVEACAYVQPAAPQVPVAANVTRVCGSEQNAAGGVPQVVAPEQTPEASQASPLVQALPSSQGVFVATFV